jgi:uncharacterized membrane protein
VVQGGQGASSRSESTRNLSIWARFWIALGIGAVAASLVPSVIHIYLRVLLAWCTGVLCFIALLGPVIRYEEPRITAARARSVSIRTLAALVATTIASLFATAFMLADLKSLPPGQRFAQVALSVLALVGAWFLNNITFAFRYAHVYYRCLADQPDAGPVVEFQGVEHAGYWDFLYMAFEVGMTFGVTDTALQSTDMRRHVLGHALLSFWFSTVILALTLNLVAGLL